MHEVTTDYVHHLNESKGLSGENRRDAYTTVELQSEHSISTARMTVAEARQTVRNDTGSADG